MTITDRCTRWSECYLIKDLKPRRLIKSLSKWLEKNTKPETILTDLGTNYITSEFKDFLNKMGIKPRNTTSYNPTGNSISERINQTITRVLMANKKVKLRQLIKKVNHTLQNQPHRSLGASPHEIVKRFSIFDPKQNKLAGLSQEVLMRMKREQEINEVNMN